MLFRMETGWVMQVQDVLFVPGLIYSMIVVLMIEKKGFKFLFQYGKARLRPRGSSSAVIFLGVRENGLYRMIGKPINHGKKKQEDHV